MCTHCNASERASSHTRANRVSPGRHSAQEVTKVRRISSKLPAIVDKHFGVPLRNPLFPNIVQGAYHTRKGRRTEEHALLYKGNIDTLEPGQEVLVRINSACYTGDIFGDQSCDCNWQLLESLRMLEEWDGPGVVLYHFAHEGKAHGYLEKLRAYDPVSGSYPVKGDKRDFTSAIAILQDLGVTHIRLMTNNPNKREALTHWGFVVTGTANVVSQAAHLQQFLRWKADNLGHEISGIPAETTPARR